ncbi:hypothetical protein JL721_1419 [Aureococcus anophagefferens]|nr:hypothetical protein JL721_1419 [Aureococcus anophagefferens]
MRAGFLSSSGKPKLKPLATPKQDREARERKRQEKLAQDRCEAYWCLVTHGIKAQCWWEMQLEASEGLKARAVATMARDANAATRVQRRWRARRRAEARGRRLLAALRRRERSAAACWDALCADRGACDLRAATARLAGARAEAALRARPAASPARRAAVAAERKQVYAFLKASDARAVEQVARAFGLRGAKRRKRRVVKALFEDAAVAPAPPPSAARHDGEPTPTSSTAPTAPGGAVPRLRRGLSANGSMLYLTVADDEPAPPAAAAAPAARAARPRRRLCRRRERFLGGDGQGATDADDEAAIARAIAEAQAEFEAEGAPASPTVRAPDASTLEALVGPAAGDFYGGNEDLPALIADLLGGVDAPAAAEANGDAEIDPDEDPDEALARRLNAANDDTDSGDAALARMVARDAEQERRRALARSAGRDPRPRRRRRRAPDPRRPPRRRRGGRARRRRRPRGGGGDDDDEQLQLAPSCRRPGGDEIAAGADEQL